MVYSRVCLGPALSFGEKSCRVYDMHHAVRRLTGVPGALLSLVQFPERYSTVGGDLATLNSPLSVLLVKVKANKGWDYVSKIKQIDLIKTEL